MTKNDFEKLYSDYLASTTDDPVRISKGGVEYKVLGIVKSTGYIEYDKGASTNANHFTRLKRA